MNRRRVALMVSMCAGLATAGCDRSGPADSNATVSIGPRAAGEATRDRIFTAAEPCVASADRLLDEATPMAALNDIKQPCGRAKAAILAIDASDQAKRICAGWIDDLQVVAELAVNVRRLRSRDSRGRLAEALDRRDQSRRTCADAALLGADPQQR